MIFIFENCHQNFSFSQAIIERGRNIVTVSKDTYIRLWSCGKQKTIEPTLSVEDCINCVDISESALNILSNEETMSEEDVEESDEIGTQVKRERTIKVLLGLG